MELAKTYHIKTFGCQANIADSNHIAGILEALGYEPLIIPSFTTENEELIYVVSHADLAIVNTCSVRQKSEDKVYGLGKVVKRALETTGRKAFIVLSGCMVGSVTGDRARYAFSELQKKTPWADLYINPSQINQLPEFLLEHKVLPKWSFDTLNRSAVLPTTDGTKHAFVNISNGCDNFCTFCVVPYSRGREVSRSEQEILTEITRLARRGITEVTLCGQNVNSWGLGVTEKFEIRAGSDDKLPFADLLRKIHALPEITKIAFISSNPFDFTQDLIDAMQLPKIANYLHIAVQSGNNDVLKRMNRRHTIEQFKELVHKIRQTKPHIEFGTDIIVGFPGETREQFMDTVQLVQDVRFNVAYIAMYSPRKGTPAEKFFADDVDREEKQWRHSYLTDVWQKSQPARAI